MASSANSSNNKLLVGYISHLSLYPVKSMAEIELNELDCQIPGARNGIFCDRSFMVTRGEEFNIITSRVAPCLLLIKPHLDGDKIRLEAPDKHPVVINTKDVEKNNQLHETTVHGYKTYGLDCGDSVASWLDEFLGKEGYRLLYFSNSLTQRAVNGGSVKYASWSAGIDKTKTMKYQDSSPIHLLSESSIADLNKNLQTPVSYKNFRGNIIVTKSEPFSEDSWQKVFIGDTEMSFMKLCSRCVMTTHDPVTSSKYQGDEPLKALRKYRKLVPSFGESPCMGINLVLERPGVIKVGDPVYAIMGVVKTEP